MAEVPGSRVRGRADGVIARVTDGEVLVLDTVADCIHQLNATAGFIWCELESGSSDEEIAASFAAEFEIDIAQARSDVNSAVSQFRDAGLICRAEAHSDAWLV